MIHVTLVGVLITGIFLFMTFRIDYGVRNQVQKQLREQVPPQVREIAYEEILKQEKGIRKSAAKNGKSDRKPQESNSNSRTTR